MKDRKKQQELLMNQLLGESNVPALSLGWYQKEKDMPHIIAYGQADTSTRRPVDTNTLFQAASLSKPVSAAIVLDLVAQGKWDLDIPLADIVDYGPPELRQDPHYRELTTRMVIGQCSGLANYGQDGDDGTRFIAKPNTRFTYSGVALDFLKQIIEQKTGREWSEFAQGFFKKVGMNNSTFQKQLPGSNPDYLHIAKAHMSDPLSHGSLIPLPSLPDDGRGVLAGAMLTNAEDYIAFLQYCFKNDYLKSTLLTGSLSTLPPTTSPETSQIEWGLGMGVYRSSDPEKTIAFHWGNNTGSISFCAMDMITGDCVVAFSNSMNGPTVFQKMAEPIVGDITPLFQWLSKYCGFNDVNRPEKSIDTTVQSIYLLSGVEPQKLTGSMQKMLLLMPSKPEFKPVELQQQSITTNTSIPQQIREDNEEQKTGEFKRLLNKEKEQREEAAAEAVKIRCRICFKEIAPKRLCSGHGGGSGGGGSTSDKASEEKITSSVDQSLTKSNKVVETTDEILGGFGSEELDLESSFDLKIIEELIAKGLLLVENDRESMTLIIKLLCEPNVLTEEQRKELKIFIEVIIKEFNEFKNENNLSNDCMNITQDAEGNILFLRINMPTLGLYDGFIQRLANNLVPVPRPKAQEGEEVIKDQRLDPNPFSMEPKPSSSEYEEVEGNEINETRDQEFAPSPFKMKPW